MLLLFLCLYANHARAHCLLITYICSTLSVTDFFDVAPNYVQWLRDQLHEGHCDKLEYID